MKNPNIEHLIQILSKFGNKYIDSSHQLKRQDLLADVNDYNKALIQTLADDPETKQAYFVPINNIYVFKADKFSQAVRDAGYWLESHTDYENHVGLAIDRHYLKDSSNVVLDFPHKDCVLDGGMTTDKSRSKNVHERFFNSVISAPQVDDLFAPKIMCHVNKYSQDHLDGISVNKFNLNKDNLIIKANNLVALHSLLHCYAGKIKLIYIDPPYNTDKDSFKYNDSFNQSTWLVFMKNRLEVARKLLTDDGVLFISLDDHEAHYCKVLTDSVFGRDNFIADIAVKSRASVSNDKIISSSNDHLLFYAKDQQTVYNHRKEYGIAPNLKGFKLSDNKGPYKLVPVDGPGGAKKDNPYYSFLGVKGYWRFSLKTMTAKYHKGLIVKKRNSLYQKYYKSKASQKRKTITTWWDTGCLTSNASKDLNKFFDGHKEFNNPKNESMLKRIIEFATKKHDIVLDFFMGSATTQATAMKMHRRFIGVEQMNYPISKSDSTDVYIKRLQKVIKGEPNGISQDKDVNWQGGGSFVFATFLNKNQKFIQLVQDAKDSNQLDHIYHQMKASADIRLDVDLKKYESKADNLPREKKRKCLIDMLDKNQLYYNYADIDDSNVRSMISDSDYQFNKSFYDGGDNK